MSENKIKILRRGYHEKIISLLLVCINFSLAACSDNGDSGKDARKQCNSSYAYKIYNAGYKMEIYEGIS